MVSAGSAWGQAARRGGFPGQGLLPYPARAATHFHRTFLGSSRTGPSHAQRLTPCSLLAAQGKSPVSGLLPHLAGSRVKDGSKLSFLQMEMLGSSNRELVQGETLRKVKEVIRAC